MKTPGKRGATRGLTNTVSIPTAAGGALIVAGDSYRRRVIIVNNDPANPIYISYGNVPTVATGFPVLAGESITLETQKNLYAIATGAAVSVSYITEDD
jgi:hypothetical protein